MPKKINKRKLNKIKRRLPTGWKTIIAEEFSLQPDTVRKVMEGTRFNSNVIEKAISMCTLPEEEKEQLIQSIAS